MSVKPDPPSPGTEPDADALSDNERRTLRLVCDTFFPSMTARGTEHAGLFVAGSAGVGLAAAVEDRLPAPGTTRRRDFRRLLRLLEMPAAGLLLLGRAVAFPDLPHAGREAYLRAMSTSRIPRLRSGFQALRRITGFLFYALEGDDADNPAWGPIGYEPASPPEVSPAPPPAPDVRSDTLDCDVCVIGSGAGGSVAAAELAQAGHSVLVLEAGGSGGAPGYPQREESAVRDLYLDSGLASTDDLSIALLAGATLGGGTSVNWQTSLRTPASVREEWSDLSGCTWFTDTSFDDSLDRVSRRLAVSTAESVVNENNAALRRGCERLGLRHALIPRNAWGCEARECGYCIFGCRRGSKRSASTTYLSDALDTGGTTVLTGCRARKILLDRGRASGVEAIVQDGNGSERPLRIRCGMVIVAAGAIHSPLLLERSGIRLPALGRNLSLHPTTAVAGVYEEPIRTWHGPPQTIVCDEYAEMDGPYGIRLECAPPHPGFLALSTPWIGARDHRRRMQEAARYSATIGLVRDAGHGRVAAGRDGLPVVRYRAGPRERDMLRTAITTLLRVHLAAGARQVFTLHTDGRCIGREVDSGALRQFLEGVRRDPVDRNRSGLFSAHQMGTCRMGVSRRSSVCDPEGRVFGARGVYVTDASAFPASSGVNPMLTIMAMADHTVRGIVAGR